MTCSNLFCTLVTSSCSCAQANCRPNFASQKSSTVLLNRSDDADHLHQDTHLRRSIRGYPSVSRKTVWRWKNSVSHQHVHDSQRRHKNKPKNYTALQQVGRHFDMFSPTLGNSTPKCGLLLAPDRCKPCLLEYLNANAFNDATCKISTLGLEKLPFATSRYGPWCNNETRNWSERNPRSKEFLRVLRRSFGPAKPNKKSFTMYWK